MGPIDKKRKSGPTNESSARTKKTFDTEDRPSKRLRPEENEKSTSSNKIPAVPKLSKAREEEAAFPRGGASVLTPLEHKQIQIEATRDVLFEQGAKSAATAEEGGEAQNATRKKTKSKLKGKGKKGGEEASPQEETVKIEGLSYKVSPRALLLDLVLT
jgi:rRNA biogenesis protein RRP5